MNCCLLSDWVAFTTAQSNVLLMNKSNDEMKILECGNDHVVCIKCSQSRKLFATCSNSKVLKIWDTSSFQCCGTRVVSKSVTAICFTQDDSLILVADKTGDVHSYSTDDIGKEGTFLLGHLSMLLDMVITMDQKYVITADRDEKIRISHFPNAYNIKAYCLGHTDFISCLLQCIHYEHVLISGSGDGTVKTWDFEPGRLLHTEFCSSPRTIGEKPNPVSCVAGLSTKPFIAVAIESDPNVTVYEIRSDGILTTNCSVTLEASPFSVCFDNSSCLWMCQADEVNHLVCFDWIEDSTSWRRITNNDNSTLKKCNEWYNSQGLMNE
ncbi:tRNA (guanine-N(7)-)-methyltransferase non-catalytic subunit wdr4-like isoform X2 [Dysidea avara]|uniref:tRNA (guanine-N(7)-)-methyltransferase non-catalytic subunit wdr4-like isoform X2 n=1 Tax=Dysidea avara TaxID=196820 RepID=UPI00331B671F